jgi:hypothetical protein
LKFKKKKVVLLNGKTPPIKHQFFLQKIKFSNIFGINYVFFIVTTLSASLKNLLLKVEVIGIAKYFLINFNNIGNQTLLVFHHNKGQSSKDLLILNKDF